MKRVDLGDRRREPERRSECQPEADGATPMNGRHPVAVAGQHGQGDGARAKTADIRLICHPEPIPTGR